MMMKTSPSGVFLLLFVMPQISVPGLGSIVWRHYSYIKQYYTWSQAQAYCRNSGHYTDLATIYTPSDLNNMHMTYYDAWINLHNPNITDGFTSSIFWVWASGYSNYLNNWAYGEPHPSESCAKLYSQNSRFYGTPCDKLLFFICYEWKQDKKHVYTFIPQSKTWAQAKQFCKDEGFTNLASIFTQDNLREAVSEADFPVWIGLHRDGETWKWSTGLSDWASEEWYSNYPDKNGSCASISSRQKLMVPQNCGDHFPFVCYKDNLVLIKEKKTWEEALYYCSSKGYRLVSVQPGTDHAYMMNMIEYEGGTEKVWTGLRFLAGHWVFLNRVSVLYSDLPLCPVEEQHCGAFLRKDTASIHPTNCLEKWNFLCYK